MSNGLQKKRAAFLLVPVLALACGCQGLNGPGIFSTNSRSSNVAPTSGTSGQTDDAAIRAARQMEQSGQLQEAIARFSALMKNGNDSPLILHRLAVLHDKTGQSNQATSLYRLALAKDPENADLLCDFGYHCFLKQDLAAAEDYCRAALRTAPAMERAHNNLALVLARTDRREQALEHFRKGGSDSQQALQNLARVEQARPGQNQTQPRRQPASAESLELAHSQQQLSIQAEQIRALQQSQAQYEEQLRQQAEQLRHQQQLAAQAEQLRQQQLAQAEQDRQRLLAQRSEQQRQQELAMIAEQEQQQALARQAEQERKRQLAIQAEQEHRQALAWQAEQERLQQLEQARVAADLKQNQPVRLDAQEQSANPARPPFETVADSNPNTGLPQIVQPEQLEALPRILQSDELANAELAGDPQDQLQTARSENESLSPLQFLPASGDSELNQSTELRPLDPALAQPGEQRPQLPQIMAPHQLTTSLAENRETATVPSSATIPESDLPKLVSKDEILNATPALAAHDAVSNSSPVTDSRPVGSTAQRSASNKLQLSSKAKLLRLEPSEWSGESNAQVNALRPAVDRGSEQDKPDGGAFPLRPAFETGSSSLKQVGHAEDATATGTKPQSVQKSSGWEF